MRSGALMGARPSHACDKGRVHTTEKLDVMCHPEYGFIESLQGLTPATYLQHCYSMTKVMP